MPIKDKQKRSEYNKKYYMKKQIEKYHHEEELKIIQDKNKTLLFPHNDSHDTFNENKTYAKEIL